MSLKVYKASAGSGKTFQLALEYIKLALSDENPYAFSHILAVTFTNKATAEMKDRILAQLYNLAHGQQDKDFFNALQKELPLPADMIEKRALATLKAIVHDYDHFKVETIDSFFQSLLTNLAHEMNLSRNFRVSLDQDEAISRAVDRLLTSLRASRKNNITQLILSYMEEHIEEDKGWNISKELKSFSSGNLFNETYLKHEGLLEQELNDPKKLTQFKNTLYTDRKNLSETLKAYVSEVLDLLSSSSPAITTLNKKSLSTISNLLNHILEDDYTCKIAKTIHDTISAPESLILTKFSNDPGSQQLAQDISSHLDRTITYYAAAAQFMHTADLVLQNLTPLVLLNTIGREVSAINHETGSFLLAKTPDLFNKMVQQEDASFVFERSGTTFKHIMIDEFQDTSGSQWQNFKTLLIENMAQGDECMLVGDIKQSIYRWRGGNWRILGNIENEMNHLGKVDIHPLATNYRSQRQVVEFNNSLFSFIAEYFRTSGKEQNAPSVNTAIFPYNDTLDTISNIYQDVKQEYKKSSDKGYVRVVLLNKNIEEEEILKDLCDQILYLHEEKQVPFDQIGILVRENKETVKIINYIAEKYPQIPITSDEAFKLSASPSVLLLVNTLKYLISSDNTVALELSHRLSSLITEISGLSSHHIIEELNSQKEKLVHMPLFELCYRLIDFYQFPQAENNSTGQSAYLYSFMDKVRTFVEENSSNLEEFLEYWEETLHGKAIAVDIKDSVYVMTIHKSKGLQRHTILIPFCNWTLDRDQAKSMIWCDTKHLNQPFNEVSLVPISTHASTKVRGSAFKEPYVHEHFEQYIDAINTLYVALTRAEQNLMLWTKEHNKGQNNIHSILKDYFYYQSKSTESSASTSKDKVSDKPGWKTQIFGEPQDYTIKGSKKIDNPLETSQGSSYDLCLSSSAAQTEFRQSNKAQDFINSIHQDATETTPDEKTENADQEQRSYIDRGKLLHQLFSMIRTADDVPHALHTLAQEGVIGGNKEQESLKKFIEKRIQNPKVSSWFDGSWNLFTECNILMRDKNNKVFQYRPDRVMRKDEQTIVIDYKFGNFNPQYITQVQRYMSALQKMGYAHVQGFLWFVYKDQIQEVSLEQQ